jgi:hypothetical protein
MNRVRDAHDHLTDQSNTYQRVSGISYPFREKTRKPRQSSVYSYGESGQPGNGNSQSGYARTSHSDHSTSYVIFVRVCYCANAIIVCIVSNIPGMPVNNLSISKDSNQVTRNTATVVLTTHITQTTKRKHTILRMAIQEEHSRSQEAIPMEALITITPIDSSILQTGEHGAVHYEPHRCQFVIIRWRHANTNYKPQRSRRAISIVPRYPLSIFHRRI